MTGGTFRGVSGLGWLGATQPHSWGIFPSAKPVRAAPINGGRQAISSTARTHTNGVRGGS